MIDYTVLDCGLLGFTKLLENVNKELTSARTFDDVFDILKKYEDEVNNERNKKGTEKRTVKVEKETKEPETKVIYEVPDEELKEADQKQVDEITVEDAEEVEQENFDNKPVKCACSCDKKYKDYVDNNVYISDFKLEFVPQLGDYMRPSDAERFNELLPKEDEISDVFFQFQHPVTSTSSESLITFTYTPKADSLYHLEDVLSALRSARNVDVFLTHYDENGKADKRIKLLRGFTLSSFTNTEPIQQEGAEYSAKYVVGKLSFNVGLRERKNF